MTSAEPRNDARASPGTSAWWRRWPAVALPAVALLLHARQLLGDRTYLRDTQLLYVPAKHYLAEVLRRGEWPQWWPWDGLGCPFLAQPMFSVFHPTTLLYLVLPFWQAFAAQDLAGTLAAVAGAYLLARALGQPRACGLAAACLFAGNGYVMGLTEHTFMKLSAATMPWYLWALLLALRRGRAWLLAPAACMGLLLLAGDPQIALLTTAAGVILAVAEGGARARALALSLLSPLAGAWLAAIQLAPSLALAGETERAGSIQGAGLWSLDLPHLVGMIIPLQTEGFASHMELGVAALGLAAASAVTLRNRRLTGALWMITALAIWLALGDAWGLNALARRVLPIWGELRYSIKSIAPAMLALSLLAGAGLWELCERPRLARRAGAVAAAALSLLAAVFLLVNVPSRDPWLYAGTFVPVLASAAIVLGWGGSRGATRVTAIGVLCAEAISFGIHALPVVGPGFYSPPALLPALREQDVGLYGPAFDRLDTSPLSRETTPFRVARAGGGEATSYGALFGLPAFTYYMPGTSLRLVRAWDPHLTPREFSRFVSIFGVRDLVVSPDLIADGPAAVGGDEVLAREPEFGYALVHLRLGLPRAYAARRARSVDGPEEAGRVLRSPEFRPGREVLIESPDALQGRVAWPDRPEAPAIDAQVVARANDSVTVTAALPWDGFVVLNESFFPGWTATVDGAPAPVWVANGIARAVEAKAGRHEVVFRWRTPGLRAGAAASAFAWVGLLVAALALRRWKEAAA